MKLETVWRPHIKMVPPLGPDDRPRYTSHTDPPTRVWELIHRRDKQVSVGLTEDLIRFAGRLGKGESGAASGGLITTQGGKERKRTTNDRNGFEFIVIRPLAPST